MEPSDSADARAEKIARHMHGAEGTSKACNISLLEAGEGRARASMRIRENMLNGHGIAHGGAIFLLADTAFAWACNSRNVTTFAQQASISFLSKVDAGETIIAEAREESVTGRTGVYTVRVTAEDGRVVAVFNGLSRTGGGAVIDEKEDEHE
ncbi:MAG: hydroxyphenylacetyl-CoA thioesterase PaaI [Pseudomonadota bacterium]